TGNPLDFIVNNTMMRVNLKEALQPGQSIRLDISWSYAITDRSMFVLSREGYEHFPEDGNNVYLIAHWYPRMAVYNDTEGWQNKQFQRLGEFALEFGNFDVEITVPEDHIVAATGTLLNSSEMLGKKQLKRLQEARQSFDKPVVIVTPEEAKANEKEKSTATKTWKFRAEN
ncbi:MAG: M1 family peptidase, partial [Mangrovimonas sp.]|nr:M1 family peptidase [Mangrovimonas sp.]